MSPKESTGANTKQNKRNGIGANAPIFITVVNFASAKRYSGIGIRTPTANNTITTHNPIRILLIWSCQWVWYSSRHWTVFSCCSSCLVCFSIVGVNVAARLVLSSHSANRGIPNILVSIEANFFPSLFSKWMERLAVSRTEATCPGANFRFLPQLLIYKIELSWNTNKDRLRPAKSIHMPSRKSNTPGMATKAVTSGAKGGVPATMTPMMVRTNPSTQTITPRTVTTIRSRTITTGCWVSSRSAWRHSSSAKPNPSRYRSIPTPVHTPTMSRGSFPSETKISGSRIREKAIVKLPQIMQGSLLPCTGRSWGGSRGF